MLGYPTILVSTWYTRTYNISIDTLDGKIVEVEDRMNNDSKGPERPPRPPWAFMGELGLCHIDIANQTVCQFYLLLYFISSELVW